MTRNVSSVWSLLIRPVSVCPAVLNSFTAYITICVAHYTKGRPQIAAMKITSIVDPKLLVRNTSLIIYIVYVDVYRND